MIILGLAKLFIFPNILDKQENIRQGEEYSDGDASSYSWISWAQTTSPLLINSLSFSNVFNCFLNPLIFWHRQCFVVAINFSKEMSIFNSFQWLQTWRKLELLRIGSLGFLWFYFSFLQNLDNDTLSSVSLAWVILPVILLTFVSETCWFKKKICHFAVKTFRKGVTSFLIFILIRALSWQLKFCKHLIHVTACKTFFHAGQFPNFNWIDESHVLVETVS